MSVLKIKKNGEWITVGTGAQGPKGADGTMTFEDLTAEQKESLRGPAGYTPVKGTDYWTAEDKAEMVSETVAAIPTPDVSGQINTHNTATDAHNDIRLLVTELTNRLNTLADSDDTTLDQMSEVVAYIKSNKALIDAITTSKVNVSDIIDNLTTNVSNKPLSAAQGVALKALVDAAATAAANAQSTADTAKANAATAQSAANSAASAASAAQTTANSKASTASYTVSVPVSWTEDTTNGGFTQTVSVSGILATDNPIADVVLGSDVEANALYLAAWALVTRITTAAGSITLYANGEAPTTAFSVQLKAVR